MEEPLGSGGKCPAGSRGSGDGFCSVVPHFPLCVRSRTLFSRSAWDHVRARAVKPAEADLGRGAFPPPSNVRRCDDQTEPQSRGKPRPLLLTAVGDDRTPSPSTHAGAKTMLHLSLAHIGLISPLHCSSTRATRRWCGRGKRRIPSRTDIVSDHSTGCKATATTTTNGLRDPTETPLTTRIRTSHGNHNEGIYSSICVI